jgi:hypothetical protein
MADDDKRTDDAHKPLDADAEQKRIAQAEEDRKAKEQAEQDRRKQARDAPLVPNAEGNVMIEAIMGPYRGQRLTVKEAEGTAAINDHWARNPVEAIYEHETLDEADRVHAIEAAQAWATATWEAAGQPPDETPEEGGGYKTRAAPTPTPEPRRR